MPDNVSPTAVIEETVDELRQQVAEQELALKNKRAEREARRQQRQLDLAEANDSSSPNDDARESSSSPTAQRFLGWQLAVLSPRPSLKDEIEQARVALAAQAAAAKAQARAHSGGSVAKIVAGAEAELARTALEEANATLERMRAAQAEAEEQLPGWLNDAEADLRIVSTPSPCDDDDDDKIDDGNRPAAPWAEFLSSPQKEVDEEEEELLDGSMRRRAICARREEVVVLVVVRRRRTSCLDGSARRRASCVRRDVRRPLLEEPAHRSLSGTRGSLLLRQRGMQLSPRATRP